MRKACGNTKSIPFFASVDNNSVVPAGCGTCSARREGPAEPLEDTIYYSAGNTVHAGGI